MGGMDETARVIRILQHVHYCLTGFSITGFVELAKVPFKRYEEMTPQLIALDVFNIIGGCDVGDGFRFLIIFSKNEAPPRSRASTHYRPIQSPDG